MARPEPPPISKKTRVAMAKVVIHHLEKASEPCAMEPEWDDKELAAISHLRRALTELHEAVRLLEIPSKPPTPRAA